MKRTLSMLTLAVLTVGLLGSCAKINERLDGLDKRIDGLENERIASIESQIGSINSSIADLGTIRSNIQSLTTTAESQGKDITDLQAADKALDKRIEDLKKYVDDTLKSYATSDWVNATFVTLEQYKATCDTIAMIDAKLSETSEQLSKDIQACADSLTEWVNTQFKGYYTAAQMDAKLAEMQAAIDTASGASQKTTDSIKTELKKAKADIDTAKAQITRQYTSAIVTAITTSEGKLTKAIQDTIATVNGRIDALAEEVTKLNSDVTDLLGRVSALEEMIQSVTIVPAYSDGSVEVADSTLHFDCIITPATSTENLKREDFTILLNQVKVLTRGTSPSVISVLPDEIFSIDTDKGTATLQADVSRYIREEGITLTVAVKVVKGKSDYTSEFVKVTTSPHGYVEIGGLKWATDNLAVTESGKQAWKGNNSTAVKVPGTDRDVVIGDYFQWGASYAGYGIIDEEQKKPENLVRYTEFDKTGYNPKEGKNLSRENSPYTYENGYIKYNNSDGITVLEREDDVANICWGGGWRMPTKDEFRALMNSTYWKWDSDDCGYYIYIPQKGDAGKVNDGDEEGPGIVGTYSKADAIMFLPAGGDIGANSYVFKIQNMGFTGYYWTSNLYLSNIDAGYCIYVDSSSPSFDAPYTRWIGQSIRPVKGAFANTDSDGDGVLDNVDECPGSPAGAKGFVDERGCPLDTDEDGIPDYLDKCPTEQGIPEYQGCFVDTDGDGIPDYLDKCPNTPAEVGYFVDWNGCTLDSDGDGVYDYEDLCPYEQGIKENKGCPEI